MMILLLVILTLKTGSASTAWSVTFENPNPCALKGSSVEFRCSYNYTPGETVKETAWQRGDLIDRLWKQVKLSDLPLYENRSEYVGDMQHDCSLVIKDLKTNDSGHYYFWFDTNLYGRRSKTSVFLSVTELHARMHPDSVRVGDRVTLDCQTPCQSHRIVWFKDGHPVAKPDFQAQTKDAGNYQCGVEGQESLLSDPIFLDVQYPPLNVSIEVSHPGHVMLHSSVNLTCTSTANPPANYTWYKAAGSSFNLMVQIGSGQMLSFPSLEVSHTGLYLCQARNQLGENNSTGVLLMLNEKETENNRLILLFGIGVKVVIVLLITPVIIWAWRQRRNSAEEENSCDYENMAWT